MTERESINTAIQMLGKLFKNNQHTWPDDMEIFVKVGALKEIKGVLGAADEYDANTLGARKKDV